MSCEAFGEEDYVAFVRQCLDEGRKDIYVDVINMVDRKVLGMVLEHTQGNKTVAAEILGLARLTLRRKLRDAKLDGNELR